MNVIKWLYWNAVKSYFKSRKWVTASLRYPISDTIYLKFEQPIQKATNKLRQKWSVKNIFSKRNYYKNPDDIKKKKNFVKKAFNTIATPTITRKNAQLSNYQSLTRFFSINKTKEIDRERNPHFKTIDSIRKHCINHPFLFHRRQAKV